MSHGPSALQFAAEAERQADERKRLVLLATDLTLTAPCGCSMRRSGPVDPSDGSIQGKTEHVPCRLHAAAGELLAAAEDAAEVLENEIAASCNLCDGEGGWDERDRMTPVRHREGCTYTALRAAIAKAELPCPEPPAGPGK